MDIGILGPLVITDRTGAPVTLRSATQRRALAALITRRGSEVTPEALADMVGVSLAALRTAISRLRATLGDDVVLTTSGAYLLGNVEVDADRFERATHRSKNATPEAQSAAAVLELCCRRNDTTNVLRALVYAALILSEHECPEAAAVALGAVGDFSYQPSDALAVTVATDRIREGLGSRYEECVSRGSKNSPLEIARETIDALNALPA